MKHPRGLVLLDEE